MKLCPQCQTKYTDDTLQFCLQDGTQLANETGEVSAMETVAFGETTTAGNSEAETVISSKPREKFHFDLAENSRPNYETNKFTESADFQDTSAKPRTFLIVLVTAFTVLFIVGIVGAGAWFYFNNTSQGISTETNSNSKPDLKTTTKNDALKKDVMQRITAWKSMAEARNLNAYMGFYADKVNYYKKRALSRRLVKRDKRKAFTKYSTIEITLTNMRIKPLENNEKAVAAFDKEWIFTNAKKRLTGQVRSQLVLKKVKNEWLIESEKDIKVYYVNR